MAEAKPAPKKPASPVAKNILKAGSSSEDSFDDGSDSEEEVKAAATKKPAAAAAPKVIDFQSYLSDLNLYLTPNSKNFYVSVDNGPRLEVLPSGLAHLLTTNGYQGTPLSSLVIGNVAIRNARGDISKPRVAPIMVCAFKLMYLFRKCFIRLKPQVTHQVGLKTEK
nr:G1/S-specific cyclin-E [Tanacetum cinerariifolium]